MNQKRIFRIIRTCSSLVTVKSAPKQVALDKRLSPQNEDQILSFNLAPFADKSPTLQEFVKLGVDLSRIEKTRGAQETILKLDFNRDVKKYIRFLHDVGVPVDELGRFFTRNPFIFEEDLENLQIRLNYLQSKKFSPEKISRILTHNPKWLSYSTVEIDERLGFFQQMFSLNGDEVRLVTTTLPTLITFKLRHVEENKFTAMEEMGFKFNETKQIILQVPKFFMKTRHKLLAQFELIHNEMKIPHELILSQPKILLSRANRTKERHLYLKALGRDVYDPREANYVSLMSIIAHDDATFSSEVAKTPVALYNKFLKTL